MFIVQVNLIVPNQHLEEFVPRLLENASDTLTEEGCDCFEVSINRGADRASFLLYEKYHNVTDFDLHLTTPHFKEFDLKTADMIEEKRVQFFESI